MSNRIQKGIESHDFGTGGWQSSIHPETGDVNPPGAGAGISSKGNSKYGSTMFELTGQAGSIHTLEVKAK